MDIYPQTLPSATAQVVELIKDLSFLNDFYLSGGTALSLQLGHRESEDLDFFTQSDFDVMRVQEELSKISPLESTQIERGTLNTYMQGVQIQLLHYPYPLLKDFIPWNNINLSSIIDIACTKLITISSRGSKKDFIDLHELLQHFTLSDIFKELSKKYTHVQYDQAHILKSLVYFVDADGQPMPRMHKELNWEEIKSAILAQVQTFTF